MKKKRELSEETMSFVKYLSGITGSENTVLSYGGHLERFFDWCVESFGSRPSELYRENVKDFVSYLKNIKRVSPKTTNAYLSALQNYNEYLIHVGRQTEYVIQRSDFIKVVEDLINPWNGEDKDVEKVRQAILASKNRYSKRDFAIITLLAFAGLRVSEMTSIYFNDVSLESGELMVRNGKGNKARTVYLNDKVVSAIREYLAVRPESDSPYLFLGRQGGKLTRGRINQICKQFSDTMNPHKYRHHFCTRSQEVGFSIAETAQQAGHKSVRTTQRYTHPDRQAVRDKLNKL